MADTIDTLTLVQHRIASAMKATLLQTNGKHAFTDEDIVPILLLHIATDTRKLLLIAEENQVYIRETMRDVGRQVQSERDGCDGENAPDGGDTQGTIRTTGEDDNGSGKSN